LKEEWLAKTTRGGKVKKFVIEREIPKIGSLQPEQMRAAAAKSNEVLRQLGPDVQWLETFVAADKTYCVYLAKDEAIIQQHAQLSGLLQPGLRRSRR
jgi:Protein of unknown function (DUF4242)